MAHNPQTFEVYRTIMTWLKTGGPDRNMLVIPLASDLLISWDGAIPLDGTIPDMPATRELRFVRVLHPLFMSPGAMYKTKDGRELTIWYDPNWESVFAIEKLLDEEQ